MTLPPDTGNHPMISVCPRTSVVSLSCKLHRCARNCGLPEASFWSLLPAWRPWPWLVITSTNISPPTSSAGCPLAASQAVPSELGSLVSEDTALRAEFGSPYLGLHMHLAVSSSPPASWDSITPVFKIFLENGSSKDLSRFTTALIKTQLNSFRFKHPGNRHMILT